MPAKSTAPTPIATITRLDRRALKFGENFRTVEAAITLPANATDAEIIEAAQTSKRIYEVLGEEMDREQDEILFTESRASDSSAAITYRQQKYIDRLLKQLGWNVPRFRTLVELVGLGAVRELSIAQASMLIDFLKGLSPLPEADPPVEAAPPMAHAEEPPHPVADQDDIGDDADRLHDDIPF